LVVEHKGGKQRYDIRGEENLGVEVKVLPFDVEVGIVVADQMVYLEVQLVQFQA